VRRTRDKTFLFEVPFTLSRSEIDEQVVAHISSCELPADLQGLIENAVLNVLIDSYSLKDMRVELRELGSFGSDATEGYHVITTEWSPGRFFIGSTMLGPSSIG